MSRETVIKYQPKGSMCDKCAHVFDNCSRLDFANMKVIETYKQPTNDILYIVKCTNFERKGEL